MRNIRKQEMWLLAAFFLGFLAGIFFVNLWGDTYLKEQTVWKTEVFQMMENGSFDQEQFFVDLMKWRGDTVLLLWLLGNTAAGVAVIFAALCWFGFSVGVVLTMSVVQLHLYGISVFLASVFLQAVFYVPLMKMLSEGILKKGLKRWSKKASADGWQEEREYFFLLVKCLPLLVAGVLLESMVSPKILAWLSKNFL